MFGPLNLNNIYAQTDKLRTRFYNLLDRFGIDRSILESKMSTSEQPKVMKESDKNMIPKDFTDDRNKQFSLESITGQKSLEQCAEIVPQEQWHESRQNIVGNAKINTDNLKTSYQDLKNEFDSGIERLKNLKGDINQNENFKPTPLNQEYLTTQGREVASNIRYNDPHHHEQRTEKEYFTGTPNVSIQERIVTPTTDKIRHHSDQVDVDQNDKARYRQQNLINEKKIL